MTPDLAAARQRARGLVAQARTGLANASGTTDAAGVKEALRRAEEAAVAFNVVRDHARQLARGSLEQRFGHAVAAATDALSVVDTSLALLDRLAAARPGAGPANLASAREAIERQLPEIRRRFDAAREATNLAVVENVTRQVSDARDRLAALVAAYGPLSLRDRGVPPALEEGARLFLAGEHQQALSVLEGAPAEATAGGELAVHVHLFRAAAAFALYVRSGETDEALLQRARADVARCRELNPGFVPDSAAFAPRFIAFFQAARPGEGTAEP